ncbi:MAG: efflux transporter outer membrane subunit [Sphingomonadales bacterium]
MKPTRPILLLTCSLLSACATVGPNYRAPGAPELSVPASYYGAPAAPSPADLAGWWTRLDDPLLDSIVQRAIGGNLDLAVAESRLRQAREAVVQARAAGLPSLAASSGVREDVAPNGHRTTTFSVGGDASWEIDLFGGIARGVEAARAGAQGSEYDLAAVRVSLIGDVVTSYVQARLAQQRLALERDTLAIADENLQIATWRREAGLVSSLDVEQARGQRAQTAATIPTLERDFSAAAYRLAVLTGQAPGALMGELQTAQPVPNAPDEVAVGIPADTLRQRPDVRAAERTLAAETARIGVAKAQLLPGLRLTGNIGSSALSVGGLVDQITGGLFAGLTAPIFEGGRLRSQVRAQEAAAQGALASYHQTVLNGLEDVENGLTALTAAKQRRADFTVALDAANNQAILARSEYRAGLTDFQTLLEAERALLSARDGLASSHADQTLAFVQLYRALGGGWQPLTTSSGIPQS